MLFISRTVMKEKNRKETYELFHNEILLVALLYLITKYCPARDFNAHPKTRNWGRSRCNPRLREWIDENGEMRTRPSRSGRSLSGPTSQAADWPPPPTRSEAGRNHFHEEIFYPPPPHWDRRAILPNHTKFRTCSVLAPMWTPPINDSAELTQGAL